MKHALFFIVSVIMLTLTSCNDDNYPIVPSTRAASDIQPLERTYSAAQETIINNMMDNLSIIFGSRIAIPVISQHEPFGIQYATIISKIPQNKIQELAKKYCTEQIIQSNDAKIDANLEYLIQTTSSQDVSDFVNFTHTYYSQGGHNFDVIDKACEGKPEIIRLCMINAAAYIDLFTFSSNHNYTKTPNKTISGGERYCLDKLIGQMENEVLAGAVVGGILNGFGIVGSLLDAGLNMTSTIQLALDFNTCIASHA